MIVPQGKTRATVKRPSDSHISGGYRLPEGQEVYIDGYGDLSDLTFAIVVTIPEGHIDTISIDQLRVG